MAEAESTPVVPKSAGQIVRAAGFPLLFRAVSFDWNQDAVHGDLQQDPQGIQVVDCGKGLALLPLVDGPRLLEAEVALQVTDGQSALLPEPLDVAPRGNQVNDGERGTVHKAYLLLTYYVDKAFLTSRTALMSTCFSLLVALSVI